MTSGRPTGFETGRPSGCGRTRCYLPFITAPKTGHAPVVTRGPADVPLLVVDLLVVDLLVVRSGLFPLLYRVRIGVFWPRCYRH